MIQLPAKNTTAGAETRLLLAECRGPSFASYSLTLAKNCLQLMDRVLWNRVHDPKPFLAKGPTLEDVIRAKGQFAGFENYPNYDNSIAARIQRMIDIANSAKDKRSKDFTDYIDTAIEVAKAQPIPDPSPGKLVAWRTAGSGSPGSSFSSYRTVLGIDFYYM